MDGLFHCSNIEQKHDVQQFFLHNCSCRIQTHDLLFIKFFSRLTLSAIRSSSLFSYVSVSLAIGTSMCCFSLELTQCITEVFIIADAFDIVKWNTCSSPTFWQMDCFSRISQIWFLFHQWLNHCHLLSIYYLLQTFSHFKSIKIYVIWCFWCVILSFTFITSSAF